MRSRPAQSRPRCWIASPAMPTGKPALSQACRSNARAGLKRSPTPLCSQPPARRRSSPARSSASMAARPPRKSCNEPPSTSSHPNWTTIMTDLVSRTALVTGASRGIGRATARALAAAGARVIVHYGNAQQEAESLVAEIRAAGGRADAVGADLSAPDGAHKLAAEVRKLVGERLDIVVANAGVATSASIEDQTVEEFDRMFAVNVRSPFFLVQQLLPLLQDGSSVVLMSPLAARASVGVLPAYSATKGAIDPLVKHFSALLGPRGIRVNAVAPGVIDTDMSGFVRSDEGRDYTLGIQAV